MKKCSKCNRVKKFTLFGKHKFQKDGLNSRCFSCARKANKEFYKKYPNSKENTRIKLLYGIDLKQYNTMLEVQLGKCWICFKEPANKKLAIDHNHITKRVRGLLCDSCNFALGALKIDNTTTLIIRALRYVKYFEERK